MNDRDFIYENGTWKELRLLTNSEHAAQFPRWRILTIVFHAASFTAVGLFAALVFSSVAGKKTNHLISGAILSYWSMSVIAKHLDKADPLKPRECDCNPEEIPSVLRNAVEQETAKSTLSFGSRQDA
jgi:hypothetical protein